MNLSDLPPFAHTWWVWEVEGWLLEAGNGFRFVVIIRHRRSYQFRLHIEVFDIGRVQQHQSSAIFPDELSAVMNLLGTVAVHLTDPRKAQNDLLTTILEYLADGVSNGHRPLAKGGFAAAIQNVDIPDGARINLHGLYSSFARKKETSGQPRITEGGSFVKPR